MLLGLGKRNLRLRLGEQVCGEVEHFFAPPSGSNHEVSFEPQIIHSESGFLPCTVALDSNLFGALEISVAQGPSVLELAGYSGEKAGLGPGELMPSLLRDLSLHDHAQVRQLFNWADPEVSTPLEERSFPVECVLKILDFVSDNPSPEREVMAVSDDIE